MAERSSPAAIFACPPKPNGSAPLAEGSSKSNFPGAMIRPNRLRIIRRAGRPVPSLWGVASATITVFSTSARMCTSGARIGSTRTTTPRRPIAILKAPPRARAALRAAAPGGTTRKFRAVPRARASLLNSSTRTTVSASPATPLYSPAHSHCFRRVSRAFVRATAASRFGAILQIDEEGEANEVQTSATRSRIFAHNYGGDAWLVRFQRRVARAEK